MNKVRMRWDRMRPTVVELACAPSAHGAQNDEKRTKLQMGLNRTRSADSQRNFAPELSRLDESNLRRRAPDAGRADT